MQFEDLEPKERSAYRDALDKIFTKNSMPAFYTDDDSIVLTEQTNCPCGIADCTSDVFYIPFEALSSLTMNRDFLRAVFEYLLIVKAYLLKGEGFKDSLYGSMYEDNLEQLDYQIKVVTTHRNFVNVTDILEAINE